MHRKEVISNGIKKDKRTQATTSICHLDKMADLLAIIVPQTFLTIQARHPSKMQNAYRWPR